jgi:hypothetical protein
VWPTTNPWLEIVACVLPSPRSWPTPVAWTGTQTAFVRGVAPCATATGGATTRPEGPAASPCAARTREPPQSSPAHRRETNCRSRRMERQSDRPDTRAPRVWSSPSRRPATRPPRPRCLARPPRCTPAGSAPDAVSASALVRGCPSVSSGLTPCVSAPTTSDVPAAGPETNLSDAGPPNDRQQHDHRLRARRPGPKRPDGPGTADLHAAAIACRRRHRGTLPPVAFARAGREAGHARCRPSPRRQRPGRPSGAE